MHARNIAAGRRARDVPMPQGGSERTRVATARTMQHLRRSRRVLAVRVLCALLACSFWLPPASGTGAKSRPVVYWKGNNAALNSTHLSEVAGRGFTHALLAASLARADCPVCTQAARSMCAAGIAPFIDVSAFMRAVSPWSNASRFKRARAELATTFHSLDGCVAGAAEDIEFPVFPNTKYTEAGVIGSQSDATPVGDLQYRIGNKVAPDALWPSFMDWPSAGAHRVPGHAMLSMDDIMFNLPKVVFNASSAASAQSYESSHSRIRMLEFPTAGTQSDAVTMIAQTFTATTRQLSRVTVIIERLGGNRNSTFVNFDVGKVNYFVTETDATGTPDLTRPALCAKPSFVAEQSLSSPCGFAPWELGLGPQQLSLYLNPEEAQLTVGKRYALIFQSQLPRSANGSWYGVHTQVRCNVARSTVCVSARARVHLCTVHQDVPQLVLSCVFDTMSG